MWRSRRDKRGERGVYGSSANRARRTRAEPSPYYWGRVAPFSRKGRSWRRVPREAGTAPAGPLGCTGTIFGQARRRHPAGCVHSLGRRHPGAAGPRSVLQAEGMTSRNRRCSTVATALQGRCRVEFYMSLLCPDSRTSTAVRFIATCPHCSRQYKRAEPPVPGVRSHCRSCPPLSPVLVWHRGSAAIP
jgi:hypothetical protein